LLRAAFESIQQQAGVYTRDLYWCCHFSSQQLPQLQQQLEQALELCVQLQDAAVPQQQRQQQQQVQQHSVQKQQQRQLLDASWQLTDALLPRIEALFLKQMLTEEPGWLTKHIAGPIPNSTPLTNSSSSSSSGSGMPAVQQSKQEEQQQQSGWTALHDQMQGLLAAVAGTTAGRTAAGPRAGRAHGNSPASTAAESTAAAAAADPEMLLGASPPPVQLPVWGCVTEHTWADQADRATACNAISAVLLQQNRQRSSNGISVANASQAHAPLVVETGSANTQAAVAAERLLLLHAEQQPLVLRGLAADWPAVSQQGWGLGWLAQQGFSGRVCLAPSLQFPFVEPQLVQYLDHIAGKVW
jgi:hypothetical protein